MPVSGSSPLARGLPPGRGVPGRSGGIIPARAGFTMTTTTVASWTTDHPRSRGVYRPKRPPRRPRCGSSPLARGLLAVLCGECTAHGIIPARAGFTRLGAHPRLRGVDHPRSRGVYAAWAAVRVESGGSSPLARGLPLGHALHALRGGIIPARAGFTFHITFSERSLFGSSPLARGLHLLGARSGQAPGIIPARAGFTCPAAGRPRPGQDHPRSRGVYCKPR